ncbi:hypothetical protein O6H91_21G024000 [Diphasiastrum complanatum]|uniref:Uncharacterized protein n=2 Tax=Diphasiastrum complanatum TaxID=34168 RepID=A0ACC2AIP9_DIPCM|nr:hypothetical protein O6H91_21G024000 [Diphasiastrum complanatum]KAJ7517429.1 hypothetical protein O6H91_21G024000 [Diphasiastrum complanatum]
MLGANEERGESELSLELCLGRPVIKPTGVRQSKGSGDDGMDLGADGCSRRTQGLNDGKETIGFGDSSMDSQIKVAADKHLAESYQASCSVGCVRSEVDDQIDFPQRLRNMPADGCVPPAESASAGAGCLVNAHGGAQWKDYIYQQRNRELQAQRQQAARKKRRMLIGEQKQQKLQLEKSKLFLGSPMHSKSSLYTQKSVEKNRAVQYQKEGASERLLLERTISETFLASQLDKIEKKQSILKEERAQFQDIHRSVQEQDRAMTDRELIAVFKPKEVNEVNLPTQFYPDHKYSQLTEGIKNLQAAQWIQESHKMMSPVAPSFTEKKNLTLDTASNFTLDASQTNCRKAEQVDILTKTVENFVDENEKESASDKGDKGQRSKIPNILINQTSAENESTDSPTTHPEVEAVAAPFFSQPLPTNNASFIQMTFAFPLHASNVDGVSAIVPYFMPYVSAQPLGSQGQSAFTSYQFCIPPESKPLQMATLEPTARGGTTPLRPTPVRHPSISSTNPRKRPGESQQQEQNCSQGGVTLLSNETARLDVSLKAHLSGDISSEYSKEGSFLDHVHSHAFSRTNSSGIEEVPVPGHSHSGKSSSSSSEVYQSAHEETVESYPIRKAGDMNVQAIQEHGQRRETETGAAATHKGLLSNGGPLVSTTANGKTINGILYTFSKGEVKIRCKCHGNYMNAGEFVIHGGGVASSHPERSIVVINPFPFANHSPEVQC